MKLTRLRVLLLLLAAAVAGWLVLLAVKETYRDGPNYSQIEDGLYLGGLVPEPPKGVTAVLNLCEAEDPYQTEFHRWDPIPDAEPAPSLDWLRQSVKWVEEQRAAGRTTYVHCWAGISRGGMVTVAYLMKRNRWARDEALAFVRTKRPGVRPNPTFMVLLAEWEKEVRDGR